MLTAETRVLAVYLGFSGCANCADVHTTTEAEAMMSACATSVGQELVELGKRGLAAGPSLSH
jgi:hypothetical protein